MPPTTDATYTRRIQLQRRHAQPRRRDAITTGALYVRRPHSPAQRYVVRQLVLPQPHPRQRQQPL
jgi:hypothetical protein